MRSRGARRAGRWSLVDPAPRPRPRPAPDQLTFQQLGEAIAAAPSRAHMKRPAPKSDYLQHCWALYCALHRWARAGGSGAFDTTWQQLAKAAGYADDAKVLHSLQRYVAMLTELGLVRVAGVRDGAGRWQRLDVELTEPEPETEPGAAETPAGAPDGRARLIAAGSPAWSLHRLTPRQRRLLDELCQGATAGRLPRQVARRITRKANLRSPERSPFSYGKGLARRAVRERTHARRPVPDQGRHDPAPQRAPGHGGCAAGGCAGGPRPAAAETAQVAVEAQRTLMRSLAAAAAQAGYRDGLLPAAVSEAVSGAASGAEVVLAAWRVVIGSTLVNGHAMHTTRRRQLEVALARLDRYALNGAGGRGEPGAGVRLAVELILADAEDRDEATGDHFRTIAGLIAWLGAEAKRWRRGARAAAGETNAAGEPIRAPRRWTGAELPGARNRKSGPGGAWPWPID